MVDGTPNPIDKLPQVDSGQCSDEPVSIEDIVGVFGVVKKQMSNIDEAPYIEISNRSGLLDENNRAQRMRPSDFTNEKGSTDMSLIQDFLDDIDLRLVNFNKAGSQTWSINDKKEILRISEILKTDIPHITAIMAGSPFRVKLSLFERKFRFLVREAQLTAHQERVQTMTERLNGITGQSDRFTEKRLLTQAQKLIIRTKRIKKGLTPEDRDALKAAYKKARVALNPTVKKSPMPRSVVNVAAFSASIPTPVVVEFDHFSPDDWSEDTAPTDPQRGRKNMILKAWAKKNKIGLSLEDAEPEELEDIAALMKAVTPIDDQARKLRDQYYEGGDAQLDAMQSLIILTNERCRLFPGTDHSNFHLAILLGRNDGQLTQEDRTAIHNLRQRRISQANAMTSSHMPVDPRVEIAPESDWEEARISPVYMPHFSPLDLHFKGAAEDARIIRLRQETPSDPPVREIVTHESLTNARLALVEMSRREAMAQALINDNRKIKSYDRRFWTLAAAAAIAITGATKIVEQIETNSITVTDTSHLVTQAVSDTEVNTPDTTVQVSTNLEEVEAVYHSNIQTATQELYPENPLLAKNIAVRDVGYAVDREADTQVALNRLPSGYDKIQKSECSSKANVGELLDCLDNRFNEDISNQVAGELVATGMVDSTIDLDVNTTILASLTGEAAPEKIAAAAAELEEQQTKHPEWFNSSSDIAQTSTPGYLPLDPTDLPEPQFVQEQVLVDASIQSKDSSSLEIIDQELLNQETKAKTVYISGRESIPDVTENLEEEIEEPVKVDKPSLEQRARGWWRSAKKKVSSFFA